MPPVRRTANPQKNLPATVTGKIILFSGQGSGHLAPLLSIPPMAEVRVIAASLGLTQGDGLTTTGFWRYILSSSGHGYSVLVVFREHLPLQAKGLCLLFLLRVWPVLPSKVCCRYPGTGYRGVLPPYPSWNGDTVRPTAYVVVEGPGGFYPVGFSFLEILLRQILNDLEGEHLFSILIPSILEFGVEMSILSQHSTVFAPPVHDVLGTPEIGDAFRSICYPVGARDSWSHIYGNCIVRMS
jgi:hypothetical protein